MKILTFYEWYQDYSLVEACDPLIVENFLGDMFDWVKAFLNIDKVPAFWWNTLTQDMMLVPEMPSSVVEQDLILNVKTGQLYQVVEKKSDGDAVCQRVRPVVQSNKIVFDLMGSGFEETFNIKSLAKNLNFRYVPNKHKKDFQDELISSLKKLAYGGGLTSLRDLGSKRHGTKATSELERRVSQERDIDSSLNLRKPGHGAYAVIAGTVPGKPNKYAFASKLIVPHQWGLEASKELDKDVDEWRVYTNNKVEGQFIDDLKKAFSLMSGSNGLRQIELVEGKPIVNFSPLYSAWVAAPKHVDRAKNKDDYFNWLKQRMYELLPSHKTVENEKFYTYDDFKDLIHRPSKKD